MTSLITCLMLLLVAVVVLPSRTHAAGAPSASPVTATAPSERSQPADQPAARAPAGTGRQARGPASASQDRALFLLFLLQTSAGSRGR
jgi:hypothetical protein